MAECGKGCDCKKRLAELEAKDYRLRSIAKRWPSIRYSDFGGQRETYVNLFTSELVEAINGK